MTAIQLEWTGPDRTGQSYLITEYSSCYLGIQLIFSWTTSEPGRCGGANDGRTPILGCTHEPRRKAAYCIDVVVCAQEKRREKREKVGESRKRRIERKGRIGGGINCGQRIIGLNGT